MADEIRNGDSKVRVVRLLGHRDDAGAWQIRDFLKRSVVESQWIELSTEEDCRRELGLSDLKSVNLPVVELPDGTRLFGPTLRDVADRLGFVTKPRLRQYDVSIYGAGSAGLSAAVYAASEGLSTVLIERSAVGGQAGTTSMIENYMGFPKGINGADLAERARQQAVKFGVELPDDAGGREIHVPRRSHLDRPRRWRDDGCPRQCLRHRRGVASSQPAQRG
jgi:thioredoxin reductase (NADPH)